MTGKDNRIETIPGQELWVSLPPHLLDGSTGLGSKASMYLIFLLTRPKTYRFSVEDIGNAFGDKFRATTSGIEELEGKGYLRRIRERADSGLFTGLKIWVPSLYPVFVTEADTGTQFDNQPNLTKQQVGSNETPNSAKQQVRVVQNPNVAKQQVRMIGAGNSNASHSQSEGIELAQNGQTSPVLNLGEVGDTTLIISSLLPAVNKKNSSKGESAERGISSRKKGEAKVRTLTSLGLAFAERYSEWMGQTKGRDYNVAGISDNHVRAFNAMAKELSTRFKLNDEKAARAFGVLLTKQDKLDNFKASMFTKPSKLHEYFTEIVDALERKGGTDAVAPAPSSQGPDQYSPAQRNYYLNYLNMWRRKFDLPKVESFGEQDVKLCQAIAEAATHSQHPPHPKDTHYAAEWRQLNQHVNA